MILWIDSNTFATSLLEKVFRQQEVEFYAINRIDDFAYLIEDLNPRLIVLDESTYLTNPDAFFRQWNSSEKMRKTPFVILDPKEKVQLEVIKLGEISRPFDPFKMPELINELMKAH